MLHQTIKQSHSRKRPTLTDTGEPVPKRGACAQKLTEVEEIVTELKSMHGNAYTIEKLNNWAHMIHMGKHSSCDIPPNLPYFKGAKNKKIRVGLIWYNVSRKEN